MKNNTLFIIMCASLSAFNLTLHATRIFKAMIPIQNASDYTLTITNKNGEILRTIEPNTSSDVKLLASAPVRINARLGDQDIDTDATRDALDLSWTVEVNNNTKEIKVTKTAQTGGRYDPKPAVK